MSHALPALASTQALRKSVGRELGPETLFGKTKDELSLFMMNDPYTKKRLILEHILWYFYIFLLTENENVDTDKENQIIQLLPDIRKHFSISKNDAKLLQLPEDIGKNIATYGGKKN